MAGVPSNPMAGGSAGSLQYFIDSIMEMWPDWAASQGLEPPDEAAAQAPASGPVVAPPGVPPPVADATPQLPPAENPAPPPSETEAAMRQNLFWDANDSSQFGIQEVPQEALFPADMLHPPQSDIDNAAVMRPPESSPLVAAAGAALSGIKTPQSPQYNLPSAPSVPRPNAVNETLLQLLQAAGLQAPQTGTGLQLGSRIR